MNFGEIKYTDIANGEGVRLSLFVSGCDHHCKGCFNEVTWDYGYGSQFDLQTMRNIIESLKRPYISGLSVLGGEPLADRNLSAVTLLCYSVKKMVPEKTIWLYTGSVFEQVKDLAVMEYIDVLVDGPFVEEKKDITLRFRGSSNQRIIDVQKTLNGNGDVVLYM